MSGMSDPLILVRIIHFEDRTQYAKSRYAVRNTDAIPCAMSWVQT